MHGYAERSKNMGSSYLVTGARLRCMWGSEPGRLVIPEGCYTADGRPKATETDCKKEINISDFGECKLCEDGKTCKECMELTDKWENTSGSSWKLEKLNEATALTMDSVIFCKKGGMIAPETSGQGDVRKINWGALMARYLVGGLAAAFGNLDYSMFGFDPINLNTGNFIYEKEDLVIHGITTLSFHITYNSMEEYSGGSLGEGWHHNYEIYITDSKDGKLDLHLGDGQVQPYRKTIGNIYTPLLKGFGLIKQEADGYRYAAGEGIEYTFDTLGRVLTKQDRNGNIDSFLYNANGQLSEVRGANGGILYYRYNKEGNLYHVSDHTGREVRLVYKYRVLYQYINASGQTYTYDYNENMRLNSVLTPRGIEGVRNIYDGANRVVKQLMPDGGMVELRYDDGGQCTYAKDQNGYITGYESDEKFRHTRTIYKDGEERFAYNENNQRTLYVDKNGNKTQYSYDDKGNLTGIIDALGRESRFTYNNNKKLITTSIEGEKILENTYDKEGHLIKTTDALGRCRETEYTEKGFPKQMILPDGSSTKITYDERGNITSITDPYNVIMKYQYDALNRVIAVSDNEDNKVCYTYDERDHLMSITNPEGAVRSYTYNASGKPVKTTDFDGSTDSIEYNAMGKPEKVSDKEGNTTIFHYDLSGNLSEEISPTGAVSVYKYDRNNRLIQIKRKASQQEEEAVSIVDYTYDPVGNLLKTQAGNEKEWLSITSYEYDALNRITAVINPAGGKTAYTYDSKSGKISSITDAAGNQQIFYYNQMGELIKAVDINGNTTQYTYNALGKVTSITDGAGRVAKYQYLPGGRREKTIYPDGRQTSYTYDSLGRLETKTNETGYSISYTYDCMGRVKLVTSSTGQKKLYQYNCMGKVTSVTDANGNITKYAYTPNGKLKEVTDALGNKTEYTYDKAGRLIHICQHGQAEEADRITQYERDAFGQIVCIRDALGGEEQFHYDALGRIIEKIDKEGHSIFYTYTADSRPESILYSDGNRAELEYTPLRQLAVIKDWLGETRINRDNQGNPVSITNHKGETVHYQWGSMGERQKITYPDGTKVSWKYDSLLRPIQMNRIAENKEPLWIDYKYNKQGHLTEKKSAGGYRTLWKYNESGQLEELLHEDAAGFLDKFHYTYDAMGNKTAIQKQRRGLPEESGCYQYSYDKLQRLIGVEKDGKHIRSYQYNTFSNRIEMEDNTKGIKNIYQYNALNQLIEQKIWETPDITTKIDTFINGNDIDKIKLNNNANILHKTFTYDKRGNLTGEYQEDALLHGYHFNRMNRLEKAWNHQGEEAQYFYNALGQRTGRTANGEREDYLLDLTKPYQNLLELQKGKQTQTFFWDFNAAVMEDEKRNLQYYLQDDLGSPLRVLYRNGYGEAYGYNEFGTELYESEPRKEEKTRKKYGKQGENQPFGYTGYRYDNISG